MSMETWYQIHMGVLSLCRKHFSTLLQGNNDTFRNVVQNPIDDDGVEISPSRHEEVKVPIMRPKNSRAAGGDDLPAELFKLGCNELVGCMH